jgi:hypothetical protein
MTQEEAVRRIERVAKEKLIELDLRGLELEELPPEIAKCMQLETLLLGAGYINNEWLKNKLTEYADLAFGCGLLGLSNATFRYLKLIPKIAQSLAKSALYGISSNC